MSAEFSICRCSLEQRADALRVLHSGLPHGQQLALVQALQGARDQTDAVFDGLLVALVADKVVAAAWAQLTPGRTAVVWLPDANSPAALALMRAMAEFLDEHEVTLAQFLAATDEPVSHELLEAGGIRELAKLAYLAADRDLFPTHRPTSQLAFSAHAGDEPERLGALLVRTYEGSLDCPQLNGIRNSADVLEGYRQQGKFAPERWFTVDHRGEDIGALIMTVHSDSGNWELVYMGLVPEHRGNGFGRKVLEFAMWQAGEGGAERLVLAVDQDNQPALENYERAGFVAWDRRTVYARLRPGKS